MDQFNTETICRGRRHTVRDRYHAINVGTTEIKVDAGIVLTMHKVSVTMETMPQTEPVLSKSSYKKGSGQSRMKLGRFSR